MLKVASVLFLTINFFALPLSSYDVSPPCYRQIQTTFFKDEIVAQALALHNINQNLWIFIRQDLQRASIKVPALVREQAAAMQPNPLDHPFDPNKALEVLEKSLYAVFFPVMNSYKYKISSSNINNDTIYRTFRYIWLQQQNYLIRCVGGSGVAY